MRTPVKPGAITIATNMAGRGTDIVLGGAQRHKDLMEKWTEVDPDIETFKTAIKKKILIPLEILQKVLHNMEKRKNKRNIRRCTQLGKIP